ncbi:MAG: response regulator [Alphaproteobacteria bacterium]
MTSDAHILIVDDHREMRLLVSQLLERNGFRVSTAADGGEMKLLLQDRNIDLIVLDLMLPAVDGLVLCRDLRAGGSNLPIVMLTARGDEVDRVVGLEMGADDYIAKPFSGRELVARIKAVLRRTHSLPPVRNGLAPTIYRFAGWALHPARREIESDDGLVVPLSGGEYSLLLAFVLRPGRVLTRDQLLDLAKGKSATPLDRSIDLQVSRLRRKIEIDPANPSLIKTVWGEGYVFTAPVVGE